MGQEEVYVWMKGRRELNDYRYFTINEVKAGLESAGYLTGTNIVSVSRALHSLRRQKFIEMRMRGNGEWLREFRCNNK